MRRGTRFEHAFRISPDSKRVAFVQYDTSPVAVLCVPEMLADRVACREQRRPPAGSANSRIRIGFAAAGKEPVWASLPAALTDFYVTHLVWFDADRLLAGVEDRSTQSLTIYSISAADGSAQAVVVERDDAWVNLARTWIVPGDARSFVFGSERSGWAHAYRIDLETGASTSPTAGDWEVDAVEAVVKGQGAASRTARVSLRPTPLSCAVGRRRSRATHHDTRLARCNAFTRWQVGCVAVQQNSRHLQTYGSAPLDLALIPGNGSIVSEDFSATRLVTPRIVSIPATRGGGKITGLLWEPTGPIPRGGRPAIVYVHGAGYTQDVKRGFNKTGGLHSLMAHAGYAVLSIDYRGSEGYGRAWRTAVHNALGDLDLADSIAAADWLAQNVAGVKRDRIGIWGTSYGGFLALMAAGRAPGSFAAHGAGAPVTNWANYDTSYTEERLGRPQQNALAYQQSSPLTYAGKVTGPVLLFHGLRDDNVHAQDSMQYADRLIEAGIRFEMMVYPAATHRQFSDAARRHSFDLLISFFDRTLRRSSEPSR
ncbi:MAG: alpha/beta fold hydrolase [Acidobacteriota bacterium]